MYNMFNETGTAILVIGLFGIALVEIYFVYWLSRR